MLLSDEYFPGQERPADDRPGDVPEQERPEDDRADSVPGPDDAGTGFPEHSPGGAFGEPFGRPSGGAPAGNALERAAFVCAIVSLLGILFNISVLFGALAVLLALLSRGARMGRRARMAVILGSAGIVVGAATLSVTLYTLHSTGIWSYMMEQISEMDPDDPTAMARVQESVLRELEHRLLYGNTDAGALTESGAGTPASPASAASEPDAPAAKAPEATASEAGNAPSPEAPAAPAEKAPDTPNAPAEEAPDAPPGEAGDGTSPYGGITLFLGGPYLPC